MKKISTLFKKDPNNLGRVINEVNPENQWVLEGRGVPTQKYDGTACAIIDGVLYKRFDLKKNRKLPQGAIPCQEPDAVTGKQPHWVPCLLENPADKWHFEGALQSKDLPDGTYELCGEKIQGNPENIQGHELIPHGKTILTGVEYFDFDYIKRYLESADIEGIVFHEVWGTRMCKIRKSDFGIKR